MGLLELFLIAAGLSMDAFAVAACIGLSIKDKKSSLDKSLITGLYFGGAQAVMPVLGYLAGARFADRITGFSGYIAFAVLAFIGGKMIKEGFDKENKVNVDLSHRKMLILAVATSIDAFAVGITFAFLDVNIASAAGFIGVVTFVFSAAGVKIGRILGLKLKNKAEFAGGLILVLMGARILLGHLEII